MISRAAIALLSAFAVIGAASAAFAQATETPEPEVAAPVQAEPAAPYDADFERLATILGSLHYLRNLCGETGNRFRDEMETLVVADQTTGPRRERMIAAFNRGYRSFASVHTTCTPIATEAAERYAEEGTALTDAMVVRFKN